MRQNMRQTNRVTVSVLLLAGLVLAFGVLLLAGRVKRSSDDTYSDSRVGMDEVAAGLSFGVYAKEDWAADLEAADGAYLTGRSLKQLLERLGVDGYVEYPGMSDRHAVTREEWFLIYDQILDLLDMERSVTKDTVLLLDQIELDGQTVLVTNRGDYCTALPGEWFGQWEAYEIYCGEGRCFGLTGSFDGELSVDNVYVTNASDGMLSFLYGGGSYELRTGEVGGAETGDPGDGAETGGRDDRGDGDGAETGERDDRGDGDGAEVGSGTAETGDPGDGGTQTGSESAETGDPGDGGTGEADGNRETIPPGVCDLVFAKGRLVSVRIKQDLIGGELLSYDSEMIEIEGYGKIGHTGTLPVYQTYGEVAEKTITDVVLGNMVVDYVTGNGEVCAILIRRPASIEDIRVLLLAEDGTNFRGEVLLVCDGPALVTCGEETAELPAGTVIRAADYLTAHPELTLTVATETEDARIAFCDAEAKPVSNGYAGSMEVRSYAEGYAVVNELPLETYLCAVVPSEMPSSYEPEALKAQAVCARSYAYIQLLRADLAAYGAHINDSTSYQVYNRVAATPESQAAVWETAGQILTYGGEPAEAYYFSTSMGYTDTAEIWNVEDPDAYGYLKSVCLNTAPAEGDLSDEETFVNYISAPAEGYDSSIRFYRWFATADYRDQTEEIGRILLQRYAASPRNLTFYAADGSELAEADAQTVQGFGKLAGIRVTERSSAGSILALGLQYEHGSVTVRSEYNIRSILGCGVDKIVYADGSENTSVTLLPSAFCAMLVQADGTVTIRGGGYGHGLGMSQNGANGMARAGMNYEEILQYFYNDIKIEMR